MPCISQPHCSEGVWGITHESGGLDSVVCLQGVATSTPCSNDVEDAGYQLQPIGCGEGRKW